MITHKDYTNTAFDNGYSENKHVKIKKINSITLDKFRTLENRTLELGENITLISGKNGTMKTTILGLIAHPFSSPNNAKDIFDTDLKTSLKEVFRLSLDKDDEYWYNLSITTTEDKTFVEPVRLYVQPEPDGSKKRHRVVVGGTNVKGRGNFLLNTSYTNFKRLYPIIETDAKEHPIDFDMYPGLVEFVSDSYSKIFGHDSFSNPITVSEPTGHLKHTFGPSDTHYDFNSISSGEDNLGYLLAKLYSFQMHITGDSKQRLQGVFCIDEIEAGLHPVAQVKLFNLLFNWSKANNIQIVATTHSLYLIQHAIEMRNENDFKGKRIQINMLSTARAENRNYAIVANPTYSQAYKELTYKSIQMLNESYKITVLCEDDVAKLYLKRLLKERRILDKLDILHGITSEKKNPGTSYTSMLTLVKNGEKLFYDTLILFDPEVDESCICSSKVQMRILPSLNKLPLEKEIVKFVYSLPNEHNIFDELGREKSDFISDFADRSIKIRELNNIDLLKKHPTSHYKNWAKNNDKEFKKLIRYYVVENKESLMTGIQSIMESINHILKSKSLPTFE